MLNADGQINPEVNGGNVFAYCGNNPVNMTDNDGHVSFWIFNKIISNAKKVIKSAIKVVQAVDKIKSSAIEGVKKTIANNKVCRDLTNFNLKNQKESTVIDSNYISAYKGTVVIRAPINNEAFSYGIIFLGNTNDDPVTVKHEYGHVRQFAYKNPIKYTLTVFVPSVLNYWKSVNQGLPYLYYSYPWEYEADRLGGIYNRPTDSWAENTYRIYSSFTD